MGEKARMSAATHTAIIKDGFASCTCKHWHGPTRSPDETYGEYTIRAYDAHVQHKAQSLTQPEQAPGLFAEQQELFS